jgi:hypothetical protein
MVRILIFVTFFPLSLPAYDLFENNKIYNDYDSFLWLEDGKAFLMEGLTEFKPLDQGALRPDPDGYIRFPGSQSQILLIPGDHYSSMLYLPPGRFFTASLRHRGNFSQLSRTFAIDIGIRSLRASSYLVADYEGAEVQFHQENLLKRFGRSCSCHSFAYLPAVAPWAEGAPGDGVGESLVLEFEEPSSRIAFLGGFVDPYRPQEFKANGRVKTLRISSEDGGFEEVYPIADLAYFADLTFPAPAQKIKIEILEVYPGALHQDTYISAILPDQSNVYLQGSVLYNLILSQSTRDDGP